MYSKHIDDVLVVVVVVVTVSSDGDCRCGDIDGGCSGGGDNRHRDQNRIVMIC